MSLKLSLPAARRIALAAQGFAAPKPAKVGVASLRKVFARLGVLQLDSVNVFERSHYLPFFSRIGAYDRAILDKLVHHDTGGRRLGSFTEYTAHEATILPVEDWPLWAWRRARPERPDTEQWAADHRKLFAEVEAEFAERGPMRISELEHPSNVRTAGGWWNKNDVYWAASRMFRKGQLVTVGRERFERVLAAAEVLPEPVTAELDQDEAILELIRRASVAYGVATLEDLADYPRLKTATASPAVDRLVELGELEPVEVAGWTKSAYLAAGARRPRSVEAATVLSPFDPVVWFRPRAERLFNFEYRISIYTPAAKRQHGYYVLPVLVDGDLVGRVDLKSDRQAGVLRVQHAHVEPAFAGESVRLARRLAPVLEEAAAWQGLGSVAVTGPGTWAADVGVALG